MQIREVRYFCLVILLVVPSALLAQNAKPNWVVHNPFEQDVFIENSQGQIACKNCEDSSKIIYSTRIHGLDIFFTTSGFTYRYIEQINHNEPGDGDEVENNATATSENHGNPEHFFSVKWQSSNPDAEVAPEEQVSFYYTYRNKSGGTIVAHAYKKILYKNLYPGIDVEFTINHDKKALEYSIIAHPGADISLARLEFEDAQTITQDEQGTIVMQSSFGQFKNNMPAKTIYAENNLPITSKVLLNGNTLSFFARYNHDKTLVIDPIIVDPNFLGYDDAYDIDYDWQGNVYAYGSCYPYQLIKLNSSGVVQWIANAYSSFDALYYYGDFAVNKLSGSCYIGKGIWSSNSNILKLNTSGFYTDSIYVKPLTEIWRMEYDACSNNIIIGGGGPDTIIQTCRIDTGLVGYTLENTLGATTPQHDVCLLTLDDYNTNYCFFAVARRRLLTDTAYMNDLIKCPLPGLTPATFIVPDGYSFIERGIEYVPPNDSVNSIYGTSANGMNGMAASPDWLYLYDGAVLKRFNKNSGALMASKHISSDLLVSGGLAVDACNNIYVGHSDTIEVLDSTESRTGITLAPGTVYDIQLSATNVLACGAGFIASYPYSTQPVSLSISHTPDSSCTLCNGTAKVSIVSCITDTSVFSYKWSNGQTSRTATGLCFGIYSVTVSLGCALQYTDTVTIPVLPSGGVSLKSTQNNESCYGDSNASITITPTGGSAPFTYSWTPGGSTSDNINNLKAGTYFVLLKDSAGCAGAIITISQPSPILVNKSSLVNVSCYQGTDGSIDVYVAGGTSPYSYSWLYIGSNSASAANLAAGIYTVMVTDSNGCKAVDSFFIGEPPPIMLYTTPDTTIYSGQSITLQATASGGASPYSYVWQSILSGPNISVSPTDTITYQVVATDANGCKTTGYVTVDILDGCNIFVPDAFSPNSDGENDILYVRGSSCVQWLDFIIYDRWGNKVFESQKLQDGWNGEYLGKPMNTGTYVYFLQAYTSDNKFVSKHGNISLIR